MCDFWSAIITKKGDILTDKSHSHSKIQKLNNLSDKVESLDDLEFYPVEIIPKEGKKIWDKPNSKNWFFNIGASRGHSDGFRPKWWKDSFESKCWRLFKKDWNIQILVNKKLKTISGFYRLIKDCEIESIRNCEIQELANSKIGEMWGSSQVGEMWGSSQVGEMWGSSQVGKMWDSSQVGEMWGSSQVGEMWDSSQVGKMESRTTTIRKFGVNVKTPLKFFGVIIDFSSKRTKVNFKG